MKAVIAMTQPPSCTSPPPSSSQLQRPPAITMSQSSNTNVVELQPMGGQQPVVQVVHVPRPQANDHLYLTVALIFLCLLLGCNTIYDFTSDGTPVVVAAGNL